MPRLDAPAQRRALGRQGWLSRIAGHVGQAPHDLALGELASVFAPGERAEWKLTPTARGTNSSTLRMMRLPGTSMPTLLVPAGSPRNAVTAVRGCTQGSGALRRGIGEVAALGASIGPPLPYPFGSLTLQIDGKTPAEVPLLALLSDILGEEVLVAVRVRPQRPNAKPVLVLASTAGRLLGYVKVGTTTLSKALVRNEAHALAGFTESERGELSFDLPRVIHHDTWRGLEVLVVTALPGGGRAPWSLVRRAARDITVRPGLEVEPFSESIFWSTILERLARLPRDNPSAVTLLAAADAISRTVGNSPLLFGGSHGDWTPWNMSLNRGRLCVWDWERSSARVPVGLDVAHHLVMVANHRHRLGVDTIAGLGRRVVPIASDLGQASAHGPLLVSLALLEMALRYEEARATGMSIPNRHLSLLTASIPLLGGSPAGRAPAAGGHAA